MKTLSIFLILLFLLTFSPSSALADKYGLLLFRPGPAWVEFSYRFDNYNFSNTSSTQNHLIEILGYRCDYALYNPHILTGKLELKLDANQDSSTGRSISGDSSRLGLEYETRVTLMDRSPIPINFFLQSRTDEISRPYGYSYRATSDSYGASLTLQNNILPGNLNVVRSVTTTDGLQQNLTRTHDEEGLRLRHAKGISNTYLDVINSEDRLDSFNGTGTTWSGDLRIYLNNELDWDTNGNGRSLSTTATYENSLGVNESRRYDVSEGLRWDLGRALRVGLTYAYSNQESALLNQQVNTGSAWLHHELFKSLTTDLQTFGHYYKIESGYDQAIGGRAAASYKKTLPAEGQLNLNVYEQYEVTDQNLGSSQRTFLNESHLVVFGQNIFLDHPYVVPSTVVVKNANIGVQPLPYVDNVDYRLDTSFNPAELVISGPGLSTRIIDDSTKPGGNNLLVTYNVTVNSQLEYSTNSQGILADVALHSGKYRIFGGFNQVRQDQLSGPLLTQPLSSSKSARIGCETTQDRLKASADYNWFSSTTSESQNINGSVTYDRTLIGGVLTLYLRNSYYWYGPDSTGVTRHSEDIFSTGGSYTASDFLSGTLFLRSNYDKWLAQFDSDRLTLSAELRWVFRKLSVALVTLAAFNNSGGATSQNEHVGIHIIRTF